MRLFNHDTHGHFAHHREKRALVSGVVGLAVLFAGCASDLLDTAGEPHELLPELDCELYDGFFSDVTWQETDVPTVLQVSWQTRQPAGVQLVFSLDAADEQAEGMAIQERLPGEALLLGMPQDSDLSFRLLASLGNERYCSDLRQARTGLLPLGLPWVDVEVPGSEAATPGFTLAAVNADGATWLTIIDHQGRTVWAWSDFAQYARIRVSADRQSVLYLGFEKSTDGSSQPGIVRLGFDGRKIGFYPVPGAWIDFVELPTGELVVMAKDARAFMDGAQERWILGDSLVRVGLDGELTTIWSIFDVHTPDLSRTYPMMQAEGGLMEEDWSHCNGLSYSPEQDALFVVSEFYEAIFKVDLPTGETAWELSGCSPDWRIDEVATLLASPHSVQLLTNGNLLVFNRHWEMNACSEVTEIHLNEETRLVNAVASFGSDECVHVPYLGSAERLPSGNTVVSWSSVGVLEQFLPDETSAQRLALPVGSAFGFATWTDSLYPQ